MLTATVRAIVLDRGSPNSCCLGSTGKCTNSLACNLQQVFFDYCGISEEQNLPCAKT